MKVLYCILCVIILPVWSYGQTLVKYDSIPYDSTSSIQSRWVDLNADGSFDILSFTRKNSDSIRVTIQKPSSDTLNTVQLNLSPDSVFFLLDDMDNNNLTDILFIGKRGGQKYLEIAYQRAEMIFETDTVMSLDVLHSLMVFDKNHDGKKDILINYTRGDNTSLQFLSDTENGWVTNSLLEFEGIADILLYGYWNGNDQEDIFVAGPEMNKLFVFNDSLGYKPVETGFAHVIAACTADLNSDGMPELLFSGQQVGSPEATYAYSHDTLSQITNLPAGVKALFSADFTSDGVPDIFYINATDSAFLTTKDSTNSWVTEYTGLKISEKNQYDFGDYDFDGDLDLLASKPGINSDSYIYKNETQRHNIGPRIVPHHISFSLPGLAVIAWERTVDDHTPSDGISYDIFVGTSIYNSHFVAPNFQLDSAKRVLWRVGNASTKNSIEIKNLSPGDYFYGIQSIDNALFPITLKDLDGAYDNIGDVPELCGNRPIACGEMIICDNSSLAYTERYACSDKTVNLNSDGIAGWYSTNQGFLGFADAINIEITAQDTVYASPENGACDQQRAFIIIPRPERKHTHLLYACLNDEVTLDAPVGYEDFNWEDKNGSFSSANSINYLVEQSDTIRLTSTGYGCMDIDTFLITFSKPEVITNPKAFEILLGQSVTLSATGAETYQWSPPTGLNNPAISNPVATPAMTTTYHVTGYDSLHCSVTDSVQVDVTNQAFVPNLFTPNNDDKNDRLLIYGLNNVKEITFIIYDRNGTKVYSSSNVDTLSSEGWNGSKNGSPQSDGIYYWKVEGHFNDGDPIMLNGKYEGVIHMVR